MSAQPDRPAFEITVDGSVLERIVFADVVEIDVHEEIGRHGRCALLVQNWDADERTVRHSDDGPFTPGARLGVALGFHADLTEVFDGFITSLTTHFPAGDRPTLRVEARAASILLEYPPRSRQLSEVTDADVVAAIAADYSLTPQADDGVTHAAVVTDRESDWSYLKRRAARIGNVLYARGDALVMRAPSAAEDPPQFDYTRDIVELHLTEDLTRAITTAVGVAWDTEVLEPIESDHGASAAELDSGDRVAHDRAVEDAGWPARKERDESPADGSAASAQARAVGRQRDAALALHHGVAVVHGSPDVRCDSWVGISGVGSRMSGPHYVTAARHRLSTSGYRTEMQLGRPPALTPPPEPARPSGLVLGIVEDLEDPEGAGRVKVRLPWRADGGDGVWARVAQLDAGPEYGSFFIPDVGREVLLGTIDDEASALVVLGQLYSGAAKPPHSISVDNEVRAFVTPEGHRLTLQDGSKAQMRLESANGHTVVIDDANGTITLTESTGGNSVEIAEGGIALAAASGDITLTASAGKVILDAQAIEGTAKGPSKFTSTATINVEASGPLGLKGALVNIN